MCGETIKVFFLSTLLLKFRFKKKKVIAKQSAKLVVIFRLSINKVAGTTVTGDT